MIAITYTSEGVGKFVSSSKMKHTWTFKMNNKTHKVDFYESKITGNFEVILDGSVTLFKGNHNNLGQAGFQFDFKINNVDMKIKSNNGAFDLIYNSKSFQYYLKNPEVNSDFSKRNTNPQLQDFGNPNFQEQLRKGILGDIPRDQPDFIKNPQPRRPTSIEISRKSSDYPSIPIKKLNSIDHANNYHKSPIKVLIIGRCQLESKGDFFFPIDFPQGAETNNVVYGLVHSNFI